MENITKQATTRLERAIAKSEKDYAKLSEKVEKYQKMVSETFRSIEVEKINLEYLNTQLKELKSNSIQ